MFIKYRTTKRLILITLSIFVFFYIIHRKIDNIDYKNPTMVSKSIKESKENKVFIQEYRFANIEIFDSSYQFPFELAWEEMSWHLELNEKNKEAIVIDSLSAHKITFLINEEKKLFSQENLGYKWIMWGDLFKSIGTTNEMINVSLSQEYYDLKVFSFIIYKQNTERDMNNNLAPLFKFDIIR